jgi:hypothetical protein
MGWLRVGVGEYKCEDTNWRVRAWGHRKWWALRKNGVWEPWKREGSSATYLPFRTRREATNAIEEDEQRKVAANWFGPDLSPRSNRVSHDVADVDSFQPSTLSWA